MQNPKFDIIRTPTQVNTEITNEKTLINDLRPKSDKEALKDIKLFNKTLKDNTQKLVKAPSFIKFLTKRGRIYSYGVNVSDFNDSISKDFRLLPFNTISNNFDKSKISSVTGTFDTMQDEINTKLSKTGTYKLKYYYLGDLIDVFMDNMYYYNRPRKIREMEVLDNMRPSHKDFNFKVILPSFKASHNRQLHR